MKLTNSFRGADDPFEGDRTRLLRSLPVGARVRRATITLSPVAGPAGRFLEEITFAGSQGTFGATMPLAGATVEVDFHARRTLDSAHGSNIQGTQANAGANLQVDLGGIYVEINSNGALKAPTDPSFALLAG